ncbi:MAG: extracellular solute-binding protein [Chloroflexi bacterium]|nr:extracellular solute-binding protein [Chloroflexota bacterium]
MNRLKTLVIAVLLMLVLAASAVGPLHAQEQEIVLQLAVPGYMEEMFTSGVLAQFEAEHPGVRVELVTTGGAGMMISIGSSAGQGDIDDVLDERETYARSADVLAIDSSDLSPEVTRAGYFLDLAPLVNSDPDLNSADFYTAVWKSFQWDGATWALPVAADAILVFYDKAAFDEAGLPYPDTWRNITDFELAIRTLTELNPDGTVARMGFMSMDGLKPLLLSLLGHGIYDDSVLPSVPQFTSPDLENVLTVWAQMKADGLFDPPMNIDSDDAATILDAPLQVGRSAFSGGIPGETEPKTPSLLPGGRAGLDVSGFAISSGTQYPEAAYELVKFLTNSPQVASSFIGRTPARRNISSVQTEGSGPIWAGPTPSPELAALLPIALEQAFPISEIRFMEYLDQATEVMAQNNFDVPAALQAMEDQALERLNTASARRDTTQIVVQTPLPTVELAPGEIALKFGVSSLMSPLPNQDQWDALAADFVARDPEVGAVQLEPVFGESLSDMTEDYDCFFDSSNLIPTADLGLLRSLDPLLAADPTYDPNDMLNGVMQQVQRDGQTWGLPVMIQPLAMRYDTDLFAQAGAFAPVNGWTVEEFQYALEALKANTGEDAPFVPRTFSNTHLLMLIAAYGGLPLDYRTNPPTINFTDPATVAAIQQVLDLAKNGYLDYSKLASTDSVMMMTIGEEDTTPLYTDSLNGIGGFGGGGGGMIAVASSAGGTSTVTSSGGGGEFQFPQNLDPLTTFPQGSSYTAMSYNISAAYISANTPYTDACYRFISEMSRHTSLITGMPARRSIINSPEIAAAQGQDMVTFYQAMDALMQKPNTVIIPMGFSFDPSAMGSTLLSFWLNRAFDRYVTDDVDLNAELAEAEMFTKDYQNCIAAIPVYDPSSDDFETYSRNFSGCAVQVDPSTEENFGG